MPNHAKVKQAVKMAIGIANTVMNVVRRSIRNMNSTTVIKIAPIISACSTLATAKSMNVLC
jgi:hypothetical protein